MNRKLIQSRETKEKTQKTVGNTTEDTNEHI